MPTLVLFLLLGLNNVSRTGLVAQGNPTAHDSFRSAKAYLEARKYHIETMGELRDGQIHLGYTAYKAVDGVIVTVVRNKFESPESAKEYLEVQIRKASKIVQRGAALKAQEKGPEDRTEVELNSNSKSHALHAVLWTCGQEYFQVQSTSLRDILAFEKVLSWHGP